MEFRNTILDNGLTVIGEVNAAAKSAAVGFFVRTGARDESLEINGVSHYLEHMLFKGTDRLSALEVNELFDRRGAQFNAFTSEENTVFYAAVLPEYLLDITGLWMELMRPALRDDDFNVEKNVIKEEIAMYKDTPSFEVIEQCRELHFASHPCGQSVLGSVETIAALTAEQMRRYFSVRYVPNNMVLACAGAFDWDRLVTLAGQRCGDWGPVHAPRALSDWPGSAAKRRRVNPHLTCEHIALMGAGVSAQDSRRFAGWLLAEIVGDEIGSRYFWELVDKALAEEATMQFEAMDGTGLLASYIRCSRENREKVMAVVRGIFEALRREGVTEAELVKARNKTLSALVIKNELPMGRLVDLGFNWLYLGRYRTIEEDIAAIKAVTCEDVNTLIDQIRPGVFSEYSIGPTALER